jgi:hypothetical protein
MLGLALSAQSAEKVALFDRSSGTIELGEDNLASVYQIDLSAFDLNEKNAKRYFNSISDNLVTYKPDFQQAKVFVHLNSQYLKSAWTLEEWQAYLDKNSDRYKKYLNHLAAE